MVPVYAIAVSLLLGAAAGVLAGMLGVGGGLIMVPVLAWLFTGQGVAAAHVMHFAVGTSLAVIIATSVSSTLAHHRRGAVRWDLWRLLTPGLLLGALLGAWLADRLSSLVLQRLFGVFAITVAAQLAWGRTPPAGRGLPPAALSRLVSLLIGAVSALVGIGGGSMTVPYLTWANLPMRNAVAVSAACGLPIAVAGALGFVVTGWLSAGTGSPTLGYVDLSALVPTALASVVFAPLGAWLAHRVPVTVLRQVFALFLVLVGLKMLLTAGH